MFDPAESRKSDPRVEKTSGRWAIGSRIALGALVLGLIGFAIPYRLVFGILLLLQFTLTAYASAEGSVRVSAILPSLTHSHRDYIF